MIEQAVAVTGTFAGLELPLEVQRMPELQQTAMLHCLPFPGQGHKARCSCLGLPAPADQLRLIQRVMRDARLQYTAMAR